MKMESAKEKQNEKNNQSVTKVKMARLKKIKGGAVCTIEKQKKGCVPKG